MQKQPLSFNWQRVQTSGQQGEDEYSEQYIAVKKKRIGLHMISLVRSCHILALRA